MTTVITLNVPVTNTKALVVTNTGNNTCTIIRHALGYA